MLSKFQIKKEIEKTIRKWLENTTADKPWVSENTAELMAEAALNVLVVMEDMQEDLKSQGYDIP
jgi:hypothetical protein